MCITAPALLRAERAAEGLWTESNAACIWQEVATSFSVRQISSQLLETILEAPFSLCSQIYK